MLSVMLFTLWCCLSLLDLLFGKSLKSNKGKNKVEIKKAALAAFLSAKPLLYQLNQFDKAFGLWHLGAIVG
jgi:hypothetical protein